MSPLEILGVLSQARDLLESGDIDKGEALIATIDRSKATAGHQLGTLVLETAVGELLADGEVDKAVSLVDQYLDNDMLPAYKGGYGARSCKCGHEYGIELEGWLCPACGEVRKLFRVNQDTTGYEQALAIVAHHNIPICREYILERIHERDKTAVRDIYRRYADLVSQHSESRYSGAWFREAMTYFMRHDSWEGMTCAVEDLASSINHHRFKKICGRKMRKCQGEGCDYEFPADESEWICPECETIRRVCQVSGLRLKDDGFCSIHSRYRNSAPTPFKFSSSRLQDLYERQATLPDITDTTKYIVLANARIQSLAESMTGIELKSAGLVLNQVAELVDALDDGDEIDPAEVRRKFRTLQRLFKSAVGEQQAWAEIMAVTEQARRHMDTITKQQVAEQQVVTMQVYTQSLIFMAQAVVQELEARLDNEELVYDIRQKLAERAETLMSLDFIEGQVDRSWP